MAQRFKTFVTRGFEFASFVRGSFNNLMRCEQGLVSLEWVALSAAVVLGAIIIGTTLMAGLEEPAQGIGNQLTINNG